MTPDLIASFGNLTYGREYIIPIPFDKRLMVEVSAAVALGAVETGVARIKDFDLDAYKAKLALMV
jgi:malate dehydrogenase (oxaloacetate-decarboxylating)/malate dehydrogenase (oxaloacetate-decarboxylating)(NADP+)